MQKSLITFETPPLIRAAASVAGRREEEGPLGGKFDISDNTDSFGKDSWEKSEGEMQHIALECALKKASVTEDSLGAIYAGDLINQCTSSSYGLLSFDVPYFGIYGACSTIAEGLILASISVSGGFFKNAAAVCSSHNCSAERQFRTPLEYGAQRAPSAQWTVTGAGAFIVSDSCLGVVNVGEDSYKICSNGTGAYITEALPGRTFDSGISDLTDMGAAMAPAAADTLIRYFEESGYLPEDFDFIATGDLATKGSELLLTLTRRHGLELGPNYTDCGLRIYDPAAQDMHSGGSGCACSALVLAAEFLPLIESGKAHDILLIGTGALMSPATVQQGGSIPGIAHLVHISSEKKKRKG